MFLTDSKSVLDALTCHGEHELRVKLSKLIESRRVVLQWIPAHCGISNNEKADALAKKEQTCNKKHATSENNKAEEDNYQEYVSSQDDT